MNRLLWSLQWFFGIYWVAIGVVHFVLPAGLPAQMSWMYDLSPTLHAASGTFEILGGLGLILPAVTRRSVQLVPLAALGLAAVMLGAMVWHVQHGSFATTGPLNAVILAVMLFVAWGRTRRVPLQGRAA